jgi:PAS domain S-box-containing protein
MQYKHFYLGLGIRLCIMLISAMASVAFYYYQQLVLSGTLLFAAIIAGASTIRYFVNVNRWISFFLLGIENEDTSLKIPKNTGSKAIDEVFKGMDKLNEQFKRIKTEINVQEAYFSSIINQSATGLFSLNNNNRVLHINPTAEKLTGLRHFHHINALQSMHHALPELLLNPEKQQQQSMVFENKYGQKIHFKCSLVNTQNESIRLFAVSDITKELDTREVDAWVKLSRTLAHEIMNNITPITTLSNVLSGYFARAKGEVEPIDENTVEKTRKGLEVIEERSISLQHFVENYRKFTRIPEPKNEKLDLGELLEKLVVSSQAYESHQAVKIVNRVEGAVSCFADKNLLSQVVLNLLKNAIEAFRSGNIQCPQIFINHHFNQDKLILQIKNNGPEISPEIREQIFVPFFSTKESGSGIGLSLSKQIMLRMEGDIRLKQHAGQTCFEVVLPVG